DLRIIIIIIILCVLNFISEVPMIGRKKSVGSPSTKPLKDKEKDKEKSFKSKLNFGGVRKVSVAGDKKVKRFFFFFLFF
ncbi:hypothetical protein M1146_07465, partial [Patescibacteria group bacterium]|nr:hypothetical protein [Patescibacteria group bacterium]